MSETKFAHNWIFSHVISMELPASQVISKIKLYLKRINTDWRKEGLFYTITKSNEKLNDIIGHLIKLIILQKQPKI